MFEKYSEYYKNIGHWINLAALQAISFLTIYILYLAIQYNFVTSLTLHVCFCTIGHFLLMSEFILLFTWDNFFGKQISRYHKAWLHATFIGLGSVLVVAGVSIEINARDEAYPHFSTDHGISGLVAMILMLVACLCGVTAIHVRLTSKIVPFVRPVWWKICHNTIGLSGYIAGMISMCFAYDSWWFELVSLPTNRQICIVVTAILLGWVVIGVVITLYNYIKSACESDE